MRADCAPLGRQFADRAPLGRQFADCAPLGINVPTVLPPTAGASQRAHPLDSVFRMLLHVERDRLQLGEFSIVRCGGLKSADETKVRGGGEGEREMW